MSAFKVTRRGLPAALAIVLVASMLGGCTLVRSLSQMLPNIRQIVTPESLTIMADADANQGYPVAIDLITVADKDAFATLSKLRAAEWFAGKRDYQRQYQNNLHVHSWEIVPGLSIAKKDLTRVDGVVAGALLFADYIGDRISRVNVTGFPEVRLELRQEDFSLAPR